MAPSRNGSCFHGQTAPEHKPSVLAGAKQGSDDDVTTSCYYLRWRARSRTLSPEPRAHVGWLEAAEQEDKEERHDSAGVETTPQTCNAPPCYGVRSRSPLHSTATPNAQLHIAANPYRKMQHSAASREMPMLRRGRVARYVAKHRYGFIVDTSAPSGPDLFVNNASLALGCHEIDTLRVGAYVTFRSDSRIVNGCADG